MNARTTALSALIAMRRQNAWADGALKDYTARDRLDRRDAALAARLVYGVVQNRMLLDFYLAQAGASPLTKLQPVVLDILRLGAYQILFLDKIPVSAAVNEAVEQTKTYANKRAAGLVNGPLRALARKRGELAQPHDPATKYSHPQPLVDCLRTSMDGETLEAFLAAENDRSISVFACFDNEEVGSNTKQGAMSTLLADTLSRLNAALGRSCEDLRCAIAKSMLVSCDNAHAVNPNHPERFDEGNRVFLNRGIVVKEAANQKYCTDAFSRAAFCAICNDAEIPYQTFANRSDSPGGSTLGNLSNTQVSMHGVDVGLPQLAMHSSFETIGVRDVTLATRALKAFYNADLRIDGADSIELG